MLIALLLVAAQAPAPDALLGPMAEPLRNRVGTWCVEARLRFRPDARPAHVQAVAESRLLGGRWLVTELSGMGFSGLGVNGYNPALRRYTGYWIDSSRGITVPVEGEYDPSARLFRTVSTERQAGGATVNVISETRMLGPDEEEVRFTAPDAAGRPFERMVLRYRRATAAGCPASDGARR